ncbi:MAG: hypothetical protein ACRDYA_02515 [Egibacteraceae bacterium]
MLPLTKYLRRADRKVSELDMVLLAVRLQPVEVRRVASDARFVSVDHLLGVGDSELVLDGRARRCRRCAGRGWDRDA